jgi:glucose-6-phosphate 1-dehydrogenase
MEAREMGQNNSNMTGGSKLAQSRVPSEPCALVIFGATGDLSFRKLLPALFNLYQRGRLPRPLLVIGCGRSSMTSDDFRQRVLEKLSDSGQQNLSHWSDFAASLFYLKLDYGSTESFREFRDALAALERAHGTLANRIFYLAVPPAAYEGISSGLSQVGISSERQCGNGSTRIVVEKPFGWDLRSSRRLNDSLRENFREEQIFRIDHYLAKETVQNVLVFRFANAIFEPLWHRLYIDHVHVTAAESLGVEGRAHYYDGSGVLRDMFQNHMMQLLALVAMEPPARFDSDSVRDEKSKVFKSIQPLDMNRLSDSLALGQYGPGMINGISVPGYRDEPGVRKGSATPTYAMMNVFVDNGRWHGVPFYLLSGKRLPRKVTEIIIEFKRVAHSMFRGAIGEAIIANRLIIRIQPEEKIQLTFQTKQPGADVNLKLVTMDFDYKQDESGPRLGAYEKAILDCMQGEQMLFWREDQVESCWAFLDPVLQVCESSDGCAPLVETYEAGSWGPQSGKDLLGSQKRLLK